MTIASGIVVGIIGVTLTLSGVFSNAEQEKKQQREREKKQLMAEVDSLKGIQQQLQDLYQRALTEQLLKVQGRIDERLEAVARLEADSTKGSKP